MADLFWFAKQVAEMMSTALFSIGLDKAFFGTKAKEGIEKVLKSDEEKRLEIGQYRARAHHYVWNVLDPAYAGPLKRKYTEAKRVGRPFYANRIEDVFSIIYGAIEKDASIPQDKKDDFRREEFVSLARAAASADPIDFDTELDFYERGQLRAYGRVAGRAAVWTWNLLTDNEPGRQAKAYLSDPDRMRDDFRKHRARAQTAMNRGSRQMISAHRRSTVVRRSHPFLRMFLRAGVVLVMFSILLLIPLLIKNF